MYMKWDAVQKKGTRAWSVMATLGILALLFFYNWIKDAIKDAHTIPENKKINLQGWIGKETEELELKEWLMLEQQTGLNASALKELVEKGDWQQVLELQEDYFAPIALKSVKTTPLTVTEYLVDERGNYTTGTEFVNIQDGDILITKNSRFLGWRNGHAGMVVDAKQGLVLEAVMLGVNTKLCRLSKWKEYPSFLVLRLKEEYPDTISEEIADYAKEKLVDIPYHLLAGVSDKFVIKGFSEVRAWESEKADIPVLEGTQCAHLIWYAYQQAGIDLDSDGGLVVTPQDIQESPYLEVIQSYGY